MLSAESHMGSAAELMGYEFRTAGRMSRGSHGVGRRALRSVPRLGSRDCVLVGLLHHTADVGDLVSIDPLRKRTHERFWSCYLQAHPLRFDETRIATPPRNQGGQA